MVNATIPTFLLYGEEPGDEPVFFAHIETIAARSSLHDWEIAPHRHARSVQILLVSRGQVEFRCDGRTTSLAGPCFMAVPIGSVHGFRFQPETHGHVLSVSAAFIARARAPQDPMLPLLTYGASAPLRPEAQERVDWLCHELLHLQEDWRRPSPLFLTLAEALVRSLEATAPSRPAPSSKDTRLSQFRELVELHLSAHHSLTWYARALGVSTKTLTRICRRQLDCTPSELIHDRLILEAQRLLCFTNASIVQVAEDLGFSDASYFSRFYRRMTGHRPLADKRGTTRPENSSSERPD